MSPESWIRVGAALMLLAVGLGAFGAHGLRTRLSPELLSAFETGVRYQAYHALAILALPGRGSWLFLGGIALFSGSLYLLALTGARKLGMITPLGGLLFLAGWASVLLKSSR